jgi:hypothetical protein
MHIIEALKKKHRAVERAEVFNNERFPQALRDYLRRLVHCDRDTAGKQFITCDGIARGSSHAVE